MTTSNLPPLSSKNQESLQALTRAIERSHGMFSLILVRCNYQTVRNRILATLRNQIQVPLREINLSPRTTTLFTAIRREIGSEQPAALMVTGLETVTDLGSLLRVINQSREEFRNHLPCPLAIWINDGILQRLIREATDFESWASITIEFEISEEDLTQFILKTTDEVFAQLLSSRENIFLDNRALSLDAHSPLRAELRAACEALHRRPEPLPVELEASTQFILGRVADNTQEEARQHYERSLALWQQAQNLERYAHVQFYLGFWWVSYAIRHLGSRPEGLQKARTYLEAAIATFEQIGRNDRVAQFINYLGEVLHRQQDWPALDALASKAFALHQRYCDLFRQAKALGLMADCAIARSNWGQAESSATLALETWQKAANLTTQPESKSFLEWERSFHRPWYLYSLGKAQRHSHKLAQATRHLEEARKTAKPCYDPDLYTQILDELREIYFEQKSYLAAYKTCQARREIQSKFNLRPFTGAGRLQASQEITNPALPATEICDRIAPEIEASGRQKDVAALLQRIERKDLRLTVIHGPSGVGKSSILQAGLLPALKQQTFDGRRVIPVLQQVYTHWVQELGHQLAQACLEAGVITDETLTLSTPDDILKQLQKNEKENFRTVLILDQFEEFFFANPTVEGRQQFYELAVEWFKILDVEVVLSMREDYIHYLLICNQLSGLEIIGNNILDKNILYYIGNFTKAEAYTIVRDRTDNTQVKFDDALIDQIVNDLADTFEQIRPIELQIVGAQLQSENITALAQYKALAEKGCQPKEILVNRYLESVVRDCGPENQEVAEIILYLLTSEDGTRPIKTKSELIQEKLYAALRKNSGQIDLILEILVRSGLVLLVPSAPHESYQLVHDYLVNLIREKVQTKHQEKIEKLEKKVKGLGKIIRLLALLLLSLVSSGCVLYVFYKNNKLLYEVTQLERDSIENYSKFEGYQTISLAKAVRAADKFSNRPDIEDRTTLPIHTLQHIVDNISEKKWFDTKQTQIFAADVSSDGQTVATAGLDRTIKLWDLNGNLIKSINTSSQIPESHQIWDIRFLAGNNQLAAIDSAGKLTVWDSETSTPLLSSPITAHQPGDYYFTRLTLSPDKSVLATAGEDGFIRLWDAQSFKPLKAWKAHQVPISSLQFSPSGKELISGDYEGTVTVWDTQNPDPATPLKHLNAPYRDQRQVVYGIALSPDETLLATASEDGLVRVWDFASGRFLYEFLAHNGKWVTAVRFMPEPASGGSGSSQSDAYRMVTSDEEGVIRSWSITPIESVQLQELRGHQGWIWNLLNTPSTQTESPLLISTSIDGTLHLWDLRDPAERSASLVTSFLGHPKNRYGRGAAWSVSYSPQGDLLATAGSDGTAKLWRLADLQNSRLTPQPVSLLKHEASPVRACESRGNHDVFWVVFSPDGQTVATAGADCTVRLWNSQDGSVKAVIAHQADAFINSVAFSPTGDYIASADSKGRLFLWTAAGEPVGDFIRTDEPIESFLSSSTSPKKEQPLFAVKFSPDGQYIATASEDGTVKLWRLDGKGTKRQLELRPAAVLPDHRNGATSVDFSEDGLIATAGKDGGVRIWSLKDVLMSKVPKPLHEISAHSQRVTWVEFEKIGNRKGELLATASKDGSVIIWDRSMEGWGLRQPGDQFKPRYQFEGHQDGALSVTFLQDGRQIAVAQGDSQIKLWKLEDTPELIQRACQWLGVDSPAPPDGLRSWFAPRQTDPDIEAVCRKQ